MALRLHFRPDMLNRAVRPDEDAATRNSLVGSAHEFLGAPGTIRLDHFMRGVTEQQKIQLVFGPEALQQFQGVGAGTDDDGAALVEFCFCVAELGRLDRSTRCVRLGKKEN